MKKSLILVLILLIFSCIFFSACASNEKYDIVGKWDVSGSSSKEFVVFKDGTAKFDGSDNVCNWTYDKKTKVYTFTQSSNNAKGSVKLSTDKNKLIHVGDNPLLSGGGRGYTRATE